MSICYTPLKAYRDSDYGITFDESRAFSQPFSLPCGQCMGCRLERSRQWAIRCVHEAQLHEKNSFITLTYDDKNLPTSKTLIKSHLQLFFKRLRKSIEPTKIKFYACGEYGLENQRPHYHAIIFGYDFGLSNYQQSQPSGLISTLLKKQKPNTNNSLQLHKSTPYGSIYTSSLLSKNWKLGFSTIAEVSFETCAYVARYCTKKINGSMAKSHYGERLPEFSTMSRREAIGKKWLEKYSTDVFPHNNVILNGRTMKIPAYYDKWLEKNDIDQYTEIKIKRESKLKPEKSQRQLYDSLQVKASQFKMLSRSSDETETTNLYDTRVLEYYRRIFHEN